MSFENIVDKIYLITTNINSERFKNFMKYLPFDEKLLKVIENTTIEYFEYEFIENKGTSKPEKIGYAHKLVCLDAISNNYNKILVFEDDARFTKNKVNLEFIFNWMNNNDWDIFYLGHVATGLQFIVNNHIIRTLSSMCTHAVCYGKKIINLLANDLDYSEEEFNYLKIKNHSQKHCGMDDLLRLECLHIKGYACRPGLFYQVEEPFGVVNVRSAGIFKNSSIEDWPDNVNDSLIIITVIILLILSILLIFS